MKKTVPSLHRECDISQLFHNSSLFPAGLVEYVLDRFYGQFIAGMDAAVIVFELEHADIISNGDQVTINQNNDRTWKNQFLHACLRRKCTMKALMKVCDLAIKVKGNPRMIQLGEDMKSELEKGPSSDPHSMEGT